MGSIGAGELLLIFLVALLVFGAKRIPEIARGLGRAMREFQDALHAVSSEIQREDVLTRPTPPLTSVPRPEPTPHVAREGDVGPQPPVK